MTIRTANHPRIRGSKAASVANIQTALWLPKHLYERAKRHAKRGSPQSLNSFIVSAVAAYVEAVERKVIDDAFAGMANDEEYRREALLIVEELGG
jgi:hypothetical protein